eukprot:COSAG01_NODE_35198_length_535_cov_1.782110_2_plen_132_part_01
MSRLFLPRNIENGKRKWRARYSLPNDPKLARQHVRLARTRSAATGRFVWSAVLLSSRAGCFIRRRSGIDPHSGMCCKATLRLKPHQPTGLQVRPITSPLPMKSDPLQISDALPGYAAISHGAELRALVCVCV